MEASLDDRFTTLLDVVREAGRIAHGYFERRSQLTVQNKGVQDLLSEADQQTEAYIRGAFSKRFPGDAFVGEESGGEYSDSVWVVDPIDGTTNFLRGTPYYCVSIAYVRRGETELGAIYAPELNQLYAARRGAGATCNGQPIRVSTTSELSKAVFGLGFSHKTNPAEFAARMRLVLEKQALVRWHGSAALMLCDVASGQTDGCFEAVLSAWDALAGALLIREAGGKAVPAESTWLKAPFLAANPAMFDQLSELMASR